MDTSPFSILWCGGTYSLMVRCQRQSLPNFLRTNTQIGSSTLTKLSRCFFKKGVLNKFQILPRFKDVFYVVRLAGSGEMSKMCSPCLRDQRNYKCDMTSRPKQISSIPPRFSENILPM
jgi:hypothetical protein